MGNKIDQALDAVSVEVEFYELLDSGLSYFVDDPALSNRWEKCQKSLRRVNGLLQMMLSHSSRFRAYCQKISLNSKKRLIDDSRLLAVYVSDYRQIPSECVYLCFGFEPCQFHLRYDDFMSNAPLVEVSAENHDPKYYEALWKAIESIKTASDLINFLGLTSGVMPD